MRKLLYLLLTVLLSLAPLAAGQAPNGTVDEPTIPQEQKEFCSVVQHYRDLQTQYSQETNPIRKAGMTQPNPSRYEEQVKQIFSPHNQFQNWIGTLRFSVVGKAVSIIFLPECGSAQQFIQFSNATPMPSGLITGMQPEDVGTIVHLNSPVAETLRTADGANQRARVSGNLVSYSPLSRLGNALNTNRYASARAYYKSRSGGMGASVALPNYLAKFTDLVPLPAKKP